MTTSYVLTIRVVSGDPNGVRVVGKSNWTGRGVTFSRSDLKGALDQELASPGIYLLIGDDPDGGFDEQVYVGQAEKVGQRLGQHQSNDGMEFWTQTVVFVSKDGSLNRAHILYIESRLLDHADIAGRVRIANKTKPPAPALSENARVEADGFLSEMLTILPVLGVSAFHKPSAPAPGTHCTYYLEGLDAAGKGVDQSDGFLVLEGAKARVQAVPSMDTGYGLLRKQLVEQGAFLKEANWYRLAKDHLFSSPSAAAAALLGRNANGRTEWKDSDGVTLKDHQSAAAGPALDMGADD